MAYIQVKNEYKFSLLSSFHLFFFFSLQRTKHLETSILRSIIVRSIRNRLFLFNTPFHSFPREPLFNMYLGRPTQNTLVMCLAARLITNSVADEVPSVQVLVPQVVSTQLLFSRNFFQLKAPSFPAGDKLTLFPRTGPRQHSRGDWYCGFLPEPTHDDVHQHQRRHE